jgi:hypothetical protein
MGSPLPPVRWAASPSSACGGSGSGSAPSSFSRRARILSACTRDLKAQTTTNGGIRWNQRWANVFHILAALPVGLEPLTSGTWNGFFGPIQLG